LLILQTALTLKPRLFHDYEIVPGASRKDTKGDEKEKNDENAKNVKHVNKEFGHDEYLVGRPRLMNNCVC
jgi:hypothetical protein